MVLTLLIPALLRAQAGSADVLGTVTDPSGAVVPNATVTIRNLGTDAERTATTNERGDYIASLLPNGRYSLKVAAQGFKTYSIAEFPLSTGERARLDAKLQTGTVTQNVEVTGVAAALQTDSSTVSSTIAEQAVQDLPLNNRNFADAIALLPGVRLSDAQTSGYTVVDRRPSTNVIVNGQSPVLNNNLIDGFDNNERANGMAGVRPSIDGIAEVKVDTSVYRAEIGRAGGAAIDLVTKAGNNQFHGSAYDYIRNDVFDARNYFASGGRKPEFRQNIFGGSVGGPIVKDKTFFFFDIELGRTIKGQTLTTTVPTPYELAHPGDFSDVVICYGGGGGPPPPPGSPPPPQGCSDTMENPPPRVVPDGSLSDIAVNLWGLIPVPNRPGTAPAGHAPENNYTASPNVTQNSQTIDARVDHRFSASDLFFARYANNPVSTFFPGLFPEVNGIFPAGNLMNFPGPSNTKSQNLQFDYVHVFSSYLLLDLKAAYTRVDVKTFPLNYGKGAAAKLGIPNVFIPSIPSTDVLPFFDLGPFQLGDANGIPNANVNNSFQYGGALTWTRGNHTFRFGSSLIRRQVGKFQNQVGGGAFPISAQAPYWTNFATFLTGVSVVELRGLNLYKFNFRSWEPSFYAQDDWRVTSKLTLNLGLRYDIFTPFTEKDDHYSNFDMKTLTFILGSQSPTLGVKTDHKDFGPRIGFAYSITPKTVLRGGYGLSWYPVEIGSSSAGTTPSDMITLPNAPYSFSYINTPPNHVTFGCPRVPEPGDPPCKNGPVVPTAMDVSTYEKIKDNPLLTAVFVRPSNTRPLQVQQINLALQREVSNYTVTGAYIGVLGNRLLRGINANQPDPAQRALPPGPPLPFVYQANGLLPYMQSIALNYNGSSSNYNALQLIVARQTRNGFAFNANYTYAHGLDNTPDQGAEWTSNPGYDYGNSSTDVRHRVAVTGSYELPFGKSFTGVKGLIIKGWRTNAIYYWQTGTPFTVISRQAAIGVPGLQFDRPDVVANPVLSNPTLGKWFNTDAFANQTYGFAGTEGKNSLYGPHNARIDFSVVKDFALTERWKVQFRAECFNISNTPIFGQPGSGLGEPGYGVISSAQDGRQMQFGLKLLF